MDSSQCRTTVKLGQHSSAFLFTDYLTSTAGQLDTAPFRYNERKMKKIVQLFTESEKLKKIPKS